MVEVKWTDQSIQDIDNIAEYISQDSVHYAELQVNDFFERAEILNEFPNTGRIVPEFKDKNIRELIVGSYRLIYIILGGERIDIIAVHHSARLLKAKHLKRK
jgi:addiction module RelE/StbE family toxin